MSQSSVCITYQGREGKVIVLITRAALAFSAAEGTLAKRKDPHVMHAESIQMWPVISK